MSFSDRRAVLAAVVATGLAAAGTAVATTAARAAAGCEVVYTVSSQWQGGFSTNITVTDQGDPVTSWRLTWSFGADQTVTPHRAGHADQLHLLTLRGRRYRPPTMDVGARAETGLGRLP